MPPVPTRRRWGDEASRDGVGGGGGGGGGVDVEEVVGGAGGGVSDGSSHPGGEGLVIVPHVGPLDFGDDDGEYDDGDGDDDDPTMPAVRMPPATGTDRPSRHGAPGIDRSSPPSAGAAESTGSWTLVPAGPGFVPDFDGPSSCGDLGDRVAEDERTCPDGGTMGRHGTGDGIHANDDHAEKNDGGVGGAVLGLAPSASSLPLVVMIIALGLAAATADAVVSRRREGKGWRSPLRSRDASAWLRRRWISWWWGSSSSTTSSSSSKLDGAGRRRRGRRRRKGRASGGGGGGPSGRPPEEPLHARGEGEGAERAAQAAADTRTYGTEATATSTSSATATGREAETETICEVDVQSPPLSPPRCRRSPSAPVHGADMMQFRRRGEEERTTPATRTFADLALEGRRGTRGMDVGVDSDSDRGDLPMEVDDVDLDGSVDVTTTPPSTPSRGEVVVASSTSSSTAVIGFVAGTPVTVRQFAMHVETVATAVSSTGLDRRRSLVLANETVLRRLEGDFEAMRLGAAEARGAAREDARRAADRREAERRHRETLGAMAMAGCGGIGGGGGGSSSVVPEEDKVEIALADLRRVAFRVFPGGHLLLCIAAAFSSKVVTRYGDALIGGYSNAGGTLHASSIVRALLDQVCGCGEVSSADDGDAAPATLYSYSLLSYAAPTFASRLSWASSSTSIADTLASARCWSGCAVASFLAPAAALALLHRCLGLFHCGPGPHRALNVAASAVVLVQPPRVGWVAAGIAELAPPIVISNACVAVATLVWLRRQRRRLFGEAIRADDAEDERDDGGRQRRWMLSRLRNVKLFILSSTCVWSTLIGAWIAMK